MKTNRLYLACALAWLYALPSGAQLSTFKLDWSSSFSPAWTTSQVAGTAFNVGGSGTDISVTMPFTGGGVFTTTQGPLGGPMTPTVSESPYQVPGSNNNLMVSLDFNRNTSYIDITFNFSTMVSGVSFRLGDIDRMDSVVLNYLDEIQVTGSDGTSTILPAITKYDNSNPNYLLLSGNVARVNPTNLIANNCATNATDQRGTINISFGTALMNSVTVRYGNSAGAQNNPTVQNIAIGDITFQKLVLPVRLLSFDASVKDNIPALAWRTASETGFSHFIVERSENGADFRTIANLPSKGIDHSIASYQYNDGWASGSVYYYRLKMVDRDGSFIYSKVVLVQVPQLSTVTVFPTSFHTHFSLTIKSSGKESVHLQLLDLSGRLVLSRNYQLTPGLNQFRMDMLSHLPPGPYFVKAGADRTVKIVKY